MVQLLVTLLFLAAVYGVIIAVFARLIRSIRRESRHAVFAGFLVFGIAAGVLVVLLWPNDSSVLPNIFGVWLGDWIYRQAIAWMGDPNSAQAHETIPWILRVPQVYLIASTALCAAAGLAAQWLFDRPRRE